MYEIRLKYTKDGVENFATHYTKTLKEAQDRAHREVTWFNKCSAVTSHAIDIYKLQHTAHYSHKSNAGSV